MRRTARRRNGEIGRYSAVGELGDGAGWLDKNDRAYNTDEYKSSKATPSGLVIKVVHSA